MVRVAILGSLLAVGCDKTDGSPSGDLGEVRLALSLPNGVSISAVAWKVLSSTNAVVVSGTINTSDPNASPSLVTSVPPGVGDTVSMTATTSAGDSCAGVSAPFNVAAGQVVPVALNLVCGAISPDGGLASIVIVATVVPGDNCPEPTSWLISPAQATSPSGTISVAITASDADVGDTVSYAWTATAGSFVDPTASSTQYVCSSTGTQTLTVAVSDNHTPTPCATRITLPSVTCL